MLKKKQETTKMWFFSDIRSVQPAEPRKAAKTGRGLAQNSTQRENPPETREEDQGRKKEKEEPATVRLDYIGFSIKDEGSNDHA